MDNVFDQDAFTMVSLTGTVNRMPFVPDILGAMGIFSESGISTTDFAIDVKDNKVTVIPTSPRGSTGTPISKPQRAVKKFGVPHLGQEVPVMADEVQNVRAFGTDNQAEGIQQKLEELLGVAVTNLDLTMEYHRLGAITGKLLDSDGSVLIDFYSDFGIAEPGVIDWELDEVAPGKEFREHCMAVIRAMRRGAGGLPIRGVTALCGDDWFDASITNPDVKEAMDRFNFGDFFRADLTYAGYHINGITFINYESDSYVDAEGNAVPFVHPNEARFIPVGTPGIFETKFAPADYMETANTVGLPRYAKPERMAYDKGVNVEVQSNPINVCLRPEVLQRATIDGTAPATP